MLSETVTVWHCFPRIFYDGSWPDWYSSSNTSYLDYTWLSWFPLPINRQEFQHIKLIMDQKQLRITHELMHTHQGLKRLVIWKAYTGNSSIRKRFKHWQNSKNFKVKPMKRWRGCLHILRHRVWLSVSKHPINYVVIVVCSYSSMHINWKTTPKKLPFS